MPFLFRMEHHCSNAETATDIDQSFMKHKSIKTGAESGIRKMSFKIITSSESLTDYQHKQYFQHFMRGKPYLPILRLKLVKNHHSTNI